MTTENKGYAAAATILALFVGFIVWIEISADQREKAVTAIQHATDRMWKVVAEDNPASVAIACSNTTDPIACEVVSSEPTTFVITYFVGDDHRVPFASRKVWIERRPQLFADRIILK